MAAGEALESYVDRAGTSGVRADGLPLMPVGVVQVLRRCFRQKPEHRWGTMLEIAEALKGVYRECTGHYPPGTSKWNKIEHRMFSFISLNWKGQPLVSYETVVNLIGSTRTQTDLRVKATLDSREYEVGVKITDQDMDRVNLRLHRTHPQWNYTIAPHHVIT